jgi:hypothetical protein
VEQCGLQLVETVRIWAQLEYKQRLFQNTPISGQTGGLVSNLPLGMGIAIKHSDALLQCISPSRVLCWGEMWEAANCQSNSMQDMDMIQAASGKHLKSRLTSIGKGLAFVNATILHFNLLDKVGS